MNTSIRDDLRTDLHDLFVGDRTIGDSFPAPLVFVAVNAVWGLGAAAVAAVIVGVAVAAWRIVRGQRVVYALGGIAAIGFTAWLALRSGRAEDYFLPGILSAAGWAVVAVFSVLVGRPLAAWASWFFRRWPQQWYWRNDVRPAYATISLIWAGYFAGRAAVQWVLYVNQQPEMLAVAKVLTSWPLMLPLLAASYVIGNRKLQRLEGPTVEQVLAGAPGPYAGGQRGF
jgi:intracellular septation protein A